MAEVNALIAAAPNSKARLIMLEQWRVGLRVSEALALEARDLHLNFGRPTLLVLHLRNAGANPDSICRHVSVSGPTYFALNE